MIATLFEPYMMLIHNFFAINIVFVSSIVTLYDHHT